MKTLLNTAVAVLLLILGAACSKTEKTDLLDLVGNDVTLVARVNIDDILANQDVTVDDFRNNPIGLSPLPADANCSSLLYMAYPDDMKALVGVLKNPADAVDALKKSGEMSKVDELTVFDFGDKTLLVVEEKTALIWGINADDATAGVRLVKAMQNAAATPLAPWKRTYITEAGDIGAIISVDNKTYGIKGGFDKNKVHLTANAFEQDGKIFNIVEGVEYATLGQCGYDIAADANILMLYGKIDPEKFNERIMSLIPEKYNNELLLRSLSANNSTAQMALFANVNARSIYNMNDIKALLTADFLTPDAATEYMDQMLLMAKGIGAKVTCDGAEAVVSMPSLFSAVMVAKDNVVSINLNNADFAARKPLPVSAADAIMWLHVGVDKTLMAMLLPAGNVSGVELDIYLRPESFDIDVELTDSTRTILQLLKR